MTITNRRSSKPARTAAIGVLGLIPLLKGRQLTLGLTILSGILAQGGTLASLAMGGWLVGGALSGLSVDPLLPRFGLFAVAVVVAAGARWWQAHISHDLAFSLIETLQIGIYDGLERGAPGVIEGRRTGDLASIATADAELMEHFYAHTLADYVGAVAVPIIALTGLFFIHPLAAATMAPFLLLVGSVPYWLSRRSAEQGQAVMSELGSLNAETVEFIQGQRDIAAFGRERDLLARLMRRAHSIAKAQRRYGSRAGVEYAAIDALTALAVLAVAWTCMALVVDGDLDRMLLPLALMLAGGALIPIAEVTQTARKLGELKAGASRILAIFNQKPQIEDRGVLRFSGGTAIHFEAVGFSYGADRGMALDGLDLVIRPGETIALVGRSGAGKSTIVNLLMRFRDVTAGAIRIGGVDIHDLPLTTLRGLVAYVPQDIHLFNESVADNIRLGCPDAPMWKVEDAARLAQAHAFIDALPNGYETLCGEGGARLSGGQRQRIAIARALLVDAPILVLDEASSSLDVENEHALRRVIASIRGKRTVIMVAHRPSTIRSADRILLVENGRIADAGSHDELLVRSDAYARLIAADGPTS